MRVTLMAEISRLLELLPVTCNLQIINPFPHSLSKPACSHLSGKSFLCPAERCSGCEVAVADNGIRCVCVFVCMEVSVEQSTPALSLQCPLRAGFPECLSGSCWQPALCPGPPNGSGDQLLKRLFACVCLRGLTQCVFCWESHKTLVVSVYWCVCVFGGGAVCGNTVYVWLLCYHKILYSK